MMNTTGMLIKTQLPTSIEDLQTLCLQQQTTINEQNHALNESSNRLKIKDQYIEQLEERLSLLLSQRYQAQSEQLNHLQAQLFDESELEQAIQDAQTALEDAQSDSPVNTLKMSRNPGIRHLLSANHCRHIYVEWTL